MIRRPIMQFGGSALCHIMSDVPIAGIVVSKEFSDMCILSPDNSIFANAHIFHDATSLNRSLVVLKSAIQIFSAKPIIVMESTSHYHRIVAQFMEKAGNEVLVINPMQTGAMKNINIRNVKSDKSDSYRIALLYRMKSLNTINKPAL